MNNTAKFDKKALSYTLGRPTYAESFMDMLYKEQGFSGESVIADIGSGTGILSRQLAERGSFVYGVEPNAEMRFAAEKCLNGFSNFHSVNATAEHTALSDNSVDFITVAQAFHWFDGEKFRKECDRILKSGGKVFLVWNIRDFGSDFNRAHAETTAKFCPTFKGFNGGVEKNDKRICDFFGNAFGYREFDNPLYYEKEKFIQRCLSSSYSLNESDGNYKEYLMAVGDLFDGFSENGVLTVGNKTVAYFG